MTNTTEKTLLNSDGKVKTIDPMRELDEVFAFMLEKNGTLSSLSLTLTDDRRGGTVYRLRRNAAVWCKVFAAGASGRPAAPDEKEAAPAKTEAAR